MGNKRRKGEWRDKMGEGIRNTKGMNRCGIRERGIKQEGGIGRDKKFR